MAEPVRQPRTYRKHRRTIGFLMAVVIAAALIATLLRPFVAPAPTSGEVIGLDFDLIQTQGTDGQPVLGLAPTLTITKPPATRTPPPSP